MQNAKQLMLDLAVAAHQSVLICGSRRDREARMKYRKPGQYLRSLPPEVQEKLKELKSDDLKDARIDGLFFFHPGFWM